MTDPFLAFERSADGESAETVLAADFDWEDLERRLQTDPDPREVIAQARAEGNMEMLSKIVTICADGVVRIKNPKQRRDLMATRLMCIATALRPIPANYGAVVAVMKLTGQSASAVERSLAFVRKNLFR